MRIPFITASALLLSIGLLWVSSSAIGATHVSLQVVLQERYAALEAAVVARDSTGIAELLAPGFTSVDVGGVTQSAAQMIGQLRGLPQDPHKISNTTILSIEQHGNTAIAIQRYHMTTTKSQPDTTSTQAIELGATSTDNWVHSNGVWLLQRTVTDDISYKVDGKLLAHKQRVTHAEVVPNNSFKPNPLRSFKTPSRLSGGSA